MRALATLLFAVAASAQQEPGPGHSRHGASFDDGPRRAAQHVAGLGTAVHMPVEGLSADAQVLFDQGVTQLHGFWYLEAERSFRSVRKLQPDCAMAHWGMAMANVEDKPRAAGLIAHAVVRSETSPPREQRWIDAWAHYYQIDDTCRVELRSRDDARVRAAIEALVQKNEKRDETTLGRQLIRDLEKLVFEFPADVEAKAFLAVQNWLNYDWGAGIPISSHAGIDALLAQVFAVAPMHPAHHYRIHLWDAEAAERALGSAAVIGDSAPAIAHQWHMAGHIYKKLHRHAEAAWQQEASARVDHAYMERDRVMPFLIHNYGHNQSWLCSSLSWIGEPHEALAVARNLAAIPRHPKHNRIDDREHIASLARASLVSVCEDHELWVEGMELAASGHLDATDCVKAEVHRLSLLGRAAFRLGRTTDAERFLGEADELLALARAQRAAAVAAAEDGAFAAKADATKVREAGTEAGRVPSDDVQAAMELIRELRGERLLARGDALAALAEFDGVANFPKTLLADAHVAAGQFDKAIEILEQEVKERPHRAPTVGRLLGAYTAAGAEKHREKIDALMTEPVLDVSSRLRDVHSPLMQRVGVGADARRPGGPKEWSDPSSDLYGDDFGVRPLLSSLGPAAWAPWTNPSFSLPWVGREDGPMRPALSLSPSGTTIGREGFDDSGSWSKPTLVVFYLGFACTHCAQQLKALTEKAGDFGAAGIQIVAIGTDPLPAASEALLALAPAEVPPFAMLADPGLAAFKVWNCYDDFEEMPLHGTLLVDADGLVRWADVGADPFTQFDWLLVESRRLLALSASTVPGAK